MTDILEAVQEDLQEESRLRTIRRTFLALILALLIIVPSTIGYLWWQNHKNTSLDKEASQFYMATSYLDKQKFNEATQVFNMLAQSNSIYGELAKFQLGFLAENTMQLSDAIKHFQGLQNSNILPKGLKEYAKVSEFRAALKQPGIDKEKILAELNEIVEQNPLYVGYYQLMRVSLLIELKKYQEANDLLRSTLNTSGYSVTTKELSKILLSNIPAE